MFILIASKEIECKLGKIWWMDRQPKEVQWSVGFLLPSRSTHCITQLIKMCSAYFSRLKSIVTWDSLLFYSSWLYWMITFCCSATFRIMHNSVDLMLVCWIFALFNVFTRGCWCRRLQPHMLPWRICGSQLHQTKLWFLCLI